MTILYKQIAEPLVHLRSLLGESEAFRTLMAAADSEEAQAATCYGYGKNLNEFLKNTIPDAATVLPRTVIALEDFTSRKVTTGSWDANIQISVLIDALPPDDTPEISDRYFDFLQRVEGVVDEVRNLTADLTRLNLTEIETAVAPQLRPQKERGNQPEVWYTVLMFGVKT